MYLKRDLEKELQNALTQFPVLLITGCRQSGKSTLLSQLFADFTYVSLDDPMLRQKALKDPALFMSQHSAPLIIDEIQYAPELLSYIKMNVDANRSEYGQYILTGSQIFPMMHGVSESLAGRVGIFELYPLSWNELISNVSTSKGVQNDPDCTWHMVRGFYPELYAMPHIMPNRWMGSYFSTYVERDVRHIKAISDISRFEAFVALLATRAGQLLNLSEVAKQVGITQPTARDWLSILESTYIVQLLRPYYNNQSKRIRRAPKLYFADTGLLCYLLGIYSDEELQRSSHIGHIFKNMVVMEFIKRAKTLPRRIPCYYWNDTSSEVDLVVESGGAVHAFEIKYAKEVRSRQFSNLERFKKANPKAKTHLLTLRENKLQLTKEIQCLFWADAITEILSHK